MDLTENLFASERVFKGRLLGLRRDTVVLPDGRRGTREVVEHPGAVGIVALTDADEVLMVEQYRYAVGRTLLEIPAGCLEPGESPLDCAVRELREETGASAASWTPLGYIYPTAGCSNEAIHLFAARTLAFSDGKLDDDEFLTLRAGPWTEVLEQCVSGENHDAKTVVALLRLARLRAAGQF